MRWEDEVAAWLFSIVLSAMAWAFFAMLWVIGSFVAREFGEDVLAVAAIIAITALFIRHAAFRE